MKINYEKIKRELDARKKELAEAKEGYCMIGQPKIDASLGANAVVVVRDEASDFIVAVADVLLKGNEFPDLQSDDEIVARIKRWVDLLGVAIRIDSLNDDEVYWRYKYIDSDCLSLSVSLHCLIRDKRENARRGFTPLKVSNYLAESLGEIIKKTKGIERFEYGYSAIIAENKEYRSLAKGAI